MAPKYRPAVRHIPTVSQVPKRVSNPDIFYDLRPSWRLRQVELIGPFGWHTLDRQTLGHIHSKLCSFESMTWREILIDAKKQNHLIAIDQLCKSAQDRLMELRLDDLDQLLSLRLTGKQRVWGILSDGVATLLWWDPEHEVCPSLLRHT